MVDLMEEMTQHEVENNKTNSMKIILCIIEIVFVDPFSRDRKGLFLKIDAVPSGFMIEDQL